MPAIIQSYDDERIRLRALTTWHPYFAQLTTTDWDRLETWLDHHRSIGVEHPETKDILPLRREKDGTWRCLHGPLGIPDITAPPYFPAVPGFLEYGEGSWLGVVRFLGYLLLGWYTFAAMAVGAWTIAWMLIGGIAGSIGLLELVYARMVRTQIPQPCAVLPQTPPIAIPVAAKVPTIAQPRPSSGQGKAGKHSVGDTTIAYEWVEWSLAILMVPILAVWPAIHALHRVFALGVNTSGHLSGFGHLVIPSLIRLFAIVSSGSVRNIPSIPAWHDMPLLLFGLVGSSTLFWYVEALMLWITGRTFLLIQLTDRFSE